MMVVVSVGNSNLWERNLLLVSKVRKFGTNLRVVWDKRVRWKLMVGTIQQLMTGNGRILPSQNEGSVFPPLVFWLITMVPFGKKRLSFCEILVGSPSTLDKIWQVWLKHVLSRMNQSIKIWKKLIVAKILNSTVRPCGPKLVVILTVCDHRCDGQWPWQSKPQ